MNKVMTPKLISDYAVRQTPKPRAKLVQAKIEVALVNRVQRRRLAEGFPSWETLLSAMFRYYMEQPESRFKK